MGRLSLIAGIAMLAALLSIGGEFFHMSGKSSSQYQASSGRDTGNILVLSWHNSFCETHSNRKECGRRHDWDNRLVLHGLWPQPRGNVYCGISARERANDKAGRWRSLPGLKLPAKLEEKMRRCMPGSLSALERHEWTKHGSCYSADPAIYYNDALSLVQQVDSSATGDYLRSNVGRRISITKLRRIFAKEFGRGSGSRVAMECRRGILSEIRISLKSGGGDIRKLLAGAAPLRSKCGEAIVDAPGLYRKRSR